MKFKNIYRETKEDAELALLSLWTPGGHRMRPAMQELLAREPIMAEPVFESMFPWETTTDPNWRTYLDANVIQRLHIGTAAGGAFEPYQHQTDSWRELRNGNSIVVTTGTGSGKTECFMYPVLSDLYTRKMPNGHDPVGAIFLYPLNALMQDQKERLGERCDSLELKFAVYNSSLKGTITTNFNSEVCSRECVREFKNDRTSCPQILLTNPSMLEFMMVRDKDNPLFERSQGKLRWIVIDEAHTYTGSAAVELAYLIKRLLQAFDVTRDQVRFVCTSATIGNPSQPQQLLDLIETIVGTYPAGSTKQLVPINGNRVLSALNASQVDAILQAAQITQTTGTNVLKVRQQLNQTPQSLSSIWAGLTGSVLQANDTETALELLDQLCDLQVGNDFVLMARGNFFMRNIEGLYACVNEHCSGRGEYSNLGFDYLTTYRGNGKCPHCGAPLLEVVQCSGCKEFMLACEENGQHMIRPTYNVNWSSISEANTELDNAEDDNTNEDDQTDGCITPQTNTGITNNDEDWQRIYLAYYGGGRTYLKPHPNYYEEYLSFNWDKKELQLNVDNNGPWVELQHDDKLFCPTCAKGSGEDGRWFSHFHSSSDWFNGILAPSLLKESAPLGFEWGKYIAFTDSRQGTAIYAKRFNTDAERSYARTQLVQALSDPLNNPIAQNIRAHLVGTPTTIINNAIANTPGATGMPIYPLKNTADCIFNQQMFDHLDYEIWMSNPSYQRGQRNPHTDEYKTALLRGIIGRRTIHKSNLESMGLITITYPQIDNQNNLPLPNECANVGIQTPEWKNFLKICLDFYVRMGNHLQAISDYEKQYLRDSNRSTPFDGNRWPQVATDNQGRVTLKQNRLILLLCAGLGINDTNTLQNRCNDVNNIMRQAFNFLSDHVLNRVNAQDPYYQIPDDNGNPGRYNGYYYLDMSPSSDRCMVRLTTNAWLCPATYAMYDTIFMGYSPAITGCLCPENIQRFRMPNNSLPTPRLGSPTFLADVQNYQIYGIWNDRHKHAYESTSTGYLTAEHSGQQDRELLNHYTQQFKSVPHTLNLLQCSTTMEMGVDIGDIELVLMTNIPPTSANYKQRAGRAGRSGQSRAVAFSLCPNTSIGNSTFENPMSILTSIIPAIKPFESETIVQRHANSFFVRQFILSQGASFKKVDNWLGHGGLCDAFMTWISNNRTNPTIQADFTQIFGSARNMSDCIVRSITTIKRIRDEYRNTQNDINTAIQNANNNNERIALSIQSIALEEQDLKKYLAENRFLPNADMPTGVVEFLHMDARTGNRLVQMRRELNTARTNYANANPAHRTVLENTINQLEREIEDILERCISTREIRVALSEYAPGQTVVINERNYVSSGIERANSFGNQNPYKYLYHCTTCGRYEYTDNPNFTNCTCGNRYRGILNGNSRNTYAIEPIRFRTDINQDYNRIENTKKEYYDIQTILTHADWTQVINGPMCQIVGSNNPQQGEIIFYNPGKGRGFNLCLDCGRMTNYKQLRKFPTDWPHKKITERRDCSVGSILSPVVLSGRFPTDFVAIKFYEDVSFNRTVDDRELLNSLGVLLCRALAERLGITNDDIDFDIHEENRRFSTIYIFDTNKGGCGYSTQMLDAAIRNDVFSIAERMLQGYTCTCEKNVNGACVKCLVDRKSQRKEKVLSKFKAMAWFAAQTMNTANHPSGAAAVTMPLQLLATNAVNSSAGTITFCVDASDMNLSEWTQKNGVIGRVIDNARSRGITVKIFVANVPSVASGAQMSQLIPFVNLPSLFQNWGVQVEAVESLEVSPGIFSALIVDNKHFFTDQKEVLPFTENWGVACNQVFENNDVPQFQVATFPTMADIIFQTDEVTCQAELSGKIRTSVGNFYLDYIEPNYRPNKNQRIDDILRNQNVDITFSDSYVNSALGSLMLVYCIKSLQDKHGFNISNVNLQFNSPKRNCNNPNWNNWTYITFNFPTANDADEYTKILFEDVLGITPIFSSIIPDHCRWIRIVPDVGDYYIEIRPDYGIDGGWQSAERYVDVDYLDGTTSIELRNVKIVYYLLIMKK